MMDFGYDDLVVPKDQGLSVGFRSPDSWTNWGIDVSNNFNDYPNKYLLSPANMATEQQLQFDTQTSHDRRFDMDCSTVRDRDQSSCSSFGGGVGGGQKQDCQLDDLSGIEPMDELFLSSLLDDMQEMEQNSPCFSSESQNCMIPVDDGIWTEATALDSDSISSNGGFPASLSSSQFSPCDMERAVLHQLKVPPLTASPDQDDCKDVQLRKEPSREESALHEFELVMAQLTTKTRICYRDALYRLAKNSIPLEAAANVDAAMDIASRTIQVEESRCGGSGVEEPETNSIDRSIANMMFNKMDLNVLQSSHRCFSTAPHNLGDAEVPVSGHEGYTVAAAVAAAAAAE